VIRCVDQHAGMKAISIGFALLTFPGNVLVIIPKIGATRNSKPRGIYFLTLQVSLRQFSNFSKSCFGSRLPFPQGGLRCQRRPLAPSVSQWRTLLISFHLPIHQSPALFLFVYQLDPSTSPWGRCSHRLGCFRNRRSLRGHGRCRLQALMDQQPYGMSYVASPFRTETGGR
jgi:hypothetical protein